MQEFGPDFFYKNRVKLRDALKQDIPIVVTANGQLQSSADNPFPFHQDPNFWYLTGIEQPDYTLVIEPKETYIIAPTLSYVQTLFDGFATDESLRALSGVGTVLDAVEGEKRLKASLARNKRVYSISASPAYLELYGMYTNPARARLSRRLKRAVPELEILDIRPQLASLRVIKQPEEIAAIRHAITINVDTLNEVQARKYAFEYEIEADIAHGFRSRGATAHSFSSVIASGDNACVLHYQDNNAPLKAGNLILADVGSEYMHYASDLTRTWSPSAPTARQTAVYNAVNDALQFGIEQLVPGGVSFYECEQRVREFVGKKLIDLKLIKRADRDSVHEYYPHAPHYLGLDVHDVGDTKQPLRPGMVLTMEPGIYIPDEGIGVRIEEDILITASGCEVLSKACPRTLRPVQ